MPIGALGITAITDFILAGEGLFLAGLLVARPKARYSAAWWWQVALLLLAVSAFLGGVDHGFFQPAGETHARRAVHHATWIVIGLMTVATVLTIAEQFLNRWRRAAYFAAAVQFAGYLVAIPIVDSYAVVIINYVPIMLWSLVCNVRGLRDGSGSWPMILSILVALLSSAAQALNWRLSDVIDRNGVYHLGMMLAVWLSYEGGLRLKGFLNSEAVKQ